VQAGLVLFASLYLFFFASIARVAVLDSGASSGSVSPLAREATVLAVVQVVSAVALVAGGALALGGRRRGLLPVLVGALSVQILLALYWAVRLNSVGNDITAGDGSSGLTWFSLFFAAMPVVALGLAVLGPARQWLGRDPDGVQGRPA
jgi:hypothetical protein